VSAIACSVGCGRVAFDRLPSDGEPGDGTLPCAMAVGHDEDHDRVDDGCDLCPHVADVDQANLDGDGVGDACDPSAVTREHIAYFDPFVARRSEWVITGATDPIYDGERMLVPMAGVTFARFPWIPGRDVYVLGGEIRAGAASGKRQVSLQLRHPTLAQAYYCEIYVSSGPGNPQVSLTSTTDGIGFVSDDLQIVQGPLADQPLRMTLVNAPPTYACNVPWRGADTDLTGTFPPSIVPGTVALVLSGVDLELEYLIAIRTD
jgi:hypothetical protein